MNQKKGKQDDKLGKVDDRIPDLQLALPRSERQKETVL